jgi:hypothetical protein
LTKEEIDAIKVPGEKLDGKYSNKISNLLQHCTVVRVEPLQGWEMEQMYDAHPVKSARDAVRAFIVQEARTLGTAEES